MSGIASRTREQIRLLCALMQRGTLQGEQIPRRLYISSSAGLTQACRPAPQTLDQAQPSSTEGFSLSATPLEEQTERAMQQVLQERVGILLLLMLECVCWGLRLGTLDK